MWQAGPGEIVLDSFRLTRFLGRGGSGDVWEAVGPGDILKAVKIARLDSVDADLGQREIEGLKRIRAIRHPFILSIERFEVVDEHLIVVMELAERSLRERFSECTKAGEKGIPRVELVRYMAECAEALDFLRTKHGLQHLDVKPANLFMIAGHVKLADFGLVQPLGTEMSSASLALSPQYAPPELFDGQIEPTADQYSLAVTYQEMLTGTRPYQAGDLRSLLAALMRGKPEVGALPTTDRMTMLQAVDRDPAKRFGSCREFVERLRKVSAFAAAERKPASTQSLKALVNKPPSEPRPKSATIAARTAAPTERIRQETERVSTPIPDYDNGERLTQTFLAYVPIQIYAHKLRGFIDELDAEVMSCTDERAQLRFTKRNWLGRRISKEAVYMQIDACSHTPTSGYRVIEVVIWMQGGDRIALERRGRTLIKLLRGHLIASDKSNVQRVSAKAKAEILT